MILMLTAGLSSLFRTRSTEMKIILKQAVNLNFTELEADVGLVTYYCVLITRVPQ
jgi:hypothetical protein